MNAEQIAHQLIAAWDEQIKKSNDAAILAEGAKQGVTVLVQKLKEQEQLNEHNQATAQPKKKTKKA